MAARPIILLVVAGASLGAACTGPKPFLIRGDANSAQVGFSGSTEGAALVAKQHCARYERLPRFLEAEENVAFFDCVLP